MAPRLNDIGEFPENSTMSNIYDHYWKNTFFIKLYFKSYLDRKNDKISV